jgi:hypothetical protein
MASATWACPHCQRRVPASVAVCRCGASRTEAQAAAALAEVAGDRLGATTRLRNEPLPTSVKALIAIMGLIIVGAIASLAVSPPRVPPGPPLLGQLDPERPSPSPFKASPRPFRPYRRR